MNMEDKRQPFKYLHTGEWEARQGAMCSGCGGFECPGVYGGMCGYDDRYSTDCPCGCRYRVNEAEGFSYAYDNTGFNWGHETPECKAWNLPPNPTNQHMFRGQKVLESQGVGAYSYSLVQDTEDDSVEGVLYCNGVKVRRLEGYDMGEMVAEMHGAMMFHASDSGDE